MLPVWGCLRLDKGDIRKCCDSGFPVVRHVGMRFYRARPKMKGTFAWSCLECLNKFSAGQGIGATEESLEMNKGICPSAIQALHIVRIRTTKNSRSGTAGTSLCLGESPHLGTKSLLGSNPQVS